MPCTKPLQGWKSKHVNANGNRTVVFDAKDGLRDRPIPVNCGQCMSCRLDASRQWAMRMMAEAQLHEENSFLTLTYSDDHVPPGLEKRHCQLFLKRLRKRTGAKIRYFLCGEYGERTMRPHYHAAIFGYQFPDLQLLHENANGDRLFSSELCDEIWGMGATTVGHMEWKSAAYVAGYVTKKLTGDQAEEQYESLDHYGELTQIESPFALMSRRPGLGRDWWDKYKTDCYPSDFIVHNGQKMQPPKYFEQILAREDPEMLKEVKFKRLKKTLENKPDAYQLMSKAKIDKARVALRQGKV
jgi:hypothetical protein